MTQNLVEIQQMHPADAPTHPHTHALAQPSAGVSGQSTTIFAAGSFTLTDANGRTQKFKDANRYTLQPERTHTDGCPWQNGCQCQVRLGVPKASLPWAKDVRAQCKSSPNWVVWMSVRVRLFGVLGLSVCVRSLLGRVRQRPFERT